MGDATTTSVTRNSRDSKAFITIKERNFNLRNGKQLAISQQLVAGIKK